MTEFQNQVFTAVSVIQPCTSVKVLDYLESRAKDPDEYIAVASVYGALEALYARGLLSKRPGKRRANLGRKGFNETLYYIESDGRKIPERNLLNPIDVPA